MARAEAMAHGSDWAHEQVVAARRAVAEAGARPEVLARAELVADRMEEVSGHVYDYVTTGKMPKRPRGLDKSPEDQIRDEMIRAGWVPAWTEKEARKWGEDRRAAKRQQKTVAVMYDQMLRSEAKQWMMATDQGGRRDRELIAEGGADAYDAKMRREATKMAYLLLDRPDELKKARQRAKRYDISEQTQFDLIGVMAVVAEPYLSEARHQLLAGYEVTAHELMDRAYGQMADVQLLHDHDAKLAPVTIRKPGWRVRRPWLDRALTVFDPWFA